MHHVSFVCGSWEYHLPFLVCSCITSSQIGATNRVMPFLATQVDLSLSRARPPSEAVLASGSLFYPHVSLLPTVQTLILIPSATWMRKCSTAGLLGTNASACAFSTSTHVSLFCLCMDFSRQSRPSGSCCQKDSSCMDRTRLFRPRLFTVTGGTRETTIHIKSMSELQEV